MEQDTPNVQDIEFPFRQHTTDQLIPYLFSAIRDREQH